MYRSQTDSFDASLGGFQVSKAVYDQLPYIYVSHLIKCAFLSVCRSWFVARKFRNRLMHMLHGNTSNIKVSHLNINGIQTEGRQPLVLSQMPELLMLTETHATEDLQKATEMQYKNLFFSWGGNATKAGVAIVAQRSKWWYCKAIQFNEPALKILQKNGR